MHISAFCSLTDGLPSCLKSTCKCFLFLSPLSLAGMNSPLAWSGMAHLSTYISSIQVFPCVQCTMKVVVNKGRSLGQHVQMTTGKVGECSDPVPNFTPEKDLSGSLVGWVPILRSPGFSHPTFLGRAPGAQLCWYSCMWDHSQVWHGID